MGDRRRGLLFGIGAYATWGLFPLYWPLIDRAGSIEVLAHRIAWTLVFVAVLLGVRPRRGRWAGFRARPRSIVYLSVAAVLIAVNWGTYIWAVNHEHIVETSLGYFINPLITVLLGVLVLGERLNRVQWTAMAIAAAAVVVLTVDYGRPPWVSLTLAFTFAFYALCKKKAAAGATEGLVVETAVLAPVAIGFLGWLELSGDAAFGHTGWGTALLLAGTGVVTAIPLLLFAGAATRVSMTTLGLLLYIAPTLQFLLGVLLYGEPMPLERLAGFGLVWVALAIFTWDGLGRRAARPESARPSSPAARVDGPG